MSDVVSVLTSSRTDLEAMGQFRERDNATVGGVRRSPTQALTSLEARVTSDRRKHTEK